MRKVFGFFIIMVLISSCSDDTLEKNYKLDYDPNHEIYLVIPVNGYQLIKVSGHILFYGHNKDYILINQKPTEQIYEAAKKPSHDENMIDVFKTQINQFWIITLNNDSIYGPLNKREYLQMRDKLGVPKKLKLNNSTLKFYKFGQRRDIEYSNLDIDVIDIDNLKGNKSR